MRPHVGHLSAGALDREAVAPLGSIAVDHPGAHHRMQQRHAEPAIRNQHPGDLGDGGTQVVKVVQRHERDRQVGHAIAKRQPDGVRDRDRMALGMGGVREVSKPTVRCPKLASTRPSRPSPQPTSTVRRPGVGTKRRNSGRWKLQKSSSSSGERAQRTQSDARVSQASRRLMASLACCHLASWGLRAIHDAPASVSRSAHGRSRSSELGSRYYRCAAARMANME